MPNGNDTTPILWANGQFDITHPDSQRQGVKVYLTDTAQDAFSVERVSLQSAIEASSTITWLTNYQLTRKNAAVGDPYTVQITLEDGAKAQDVCVWLYKGAGPVQIKNVIYQANSIRFQLSSSDPAIGIS